MKNTYQSFKAFVAALPLVLFISLLSCLIYYTSIIRINLETLANIESISKDIILKTKIYQKYLCLINDDTTIDSFIYDDIVVEVDRVNKVLRFKDYEIVTNI